MPYPKLVDNNRVWTATDGNTIVPADHNEFQDQVKTVFKGHVLPVYMGNFIDWTGTAKWAWEVYQDDGGTKLIPRLKWTANNALDPIYIPIPRARTGMYISEVSWVTKASMAGAGSGSYVRMVSLPTSGNKPEYNLLNHDQGFISASELWNHAGAYYTGTKALTVTLTEPPDATHNGNWYLAISAPGAVGDSAELYHLSLTVQDDAPA